MTKNVMQKRWNLNLLDIFIILFVILAGLAFYFTFIKPIKFSHLIAREDINRYIEIEIILPEENVWVKEVVPIGEERRNIYGELEWKILAFEEETLAGKKWTKVKARVLAWQNNSGFLHYGSFEIVQGGFIVLENNRYYLRGWTRQFKILEEKALM